MNKKSFLSFIFLSFALIMNAQVGINTTNPQGIFNIDGAKDNDSIGVPTADQQANDVTVDANGNLGIGTTAPTNKLHIISAANPLKLVGVGNGITSTDRILVIDSTGVVKSIETLNSLSIPRPALFRLDKSHENFLENQGAGESQIIPMSLIKNNIANLTYNNNTITFPKGTYQITLIYEGFHNATDCTISSYFVDFPNPDDPFYTRVHSTAAHVQGGTSSHGGSITYATTLKDDTTDWTIHLGRGQSGNCTGAGMTLHGISTQLIVYRLGD